MKKDDCVFCKIAAGIIPSNTVYEDERYRAILDLNPAEKGHTLILPKEHFDDIFEADEETLKSIMDVAILVGRAIRKVMKPDGINIVINAGEAAGQTVRHLHVHIIPRFKGHTKILNWIQHESDPKEQEEIAEKIKAELIKIKARKINRDVTN